MVAVSKWMQELEECRGSHVYDRRQPAASATLPLPAFCKSRSQLCSCSVRQS